MNIEEMLKIFYLDNVRKFFGDCDSVKVEGKCMIVSLFGLEMIMKIDFRERWS